MGIEFSFHETKRDPGMDGGIASTTQMCLVPRTCTLENSYNGKCYILCIVPQ